MREHRLILSAIGLAALVLSHTACSSSSERRAGNEGTGAVAPSAPAESVVTGEVMDFMCAQKEEKGGADHRECALFCVDGRIGPPQPWAIRTSDHKVYKVDPSTGDAILTQLRDSVTKFVEVSGTISSEGPISSIVVKSVRLYQVGRGGTSQQGKRVSARISPLTRS